ncbi:MAG: hypothetical protein U1D30_09850 [Planctomycetota bacterium]
MPRLDMSIEHRKSNVVFPGPVAWKALALAAFRGVHELVPGPDITFLSGNKIREDLKRPSPRATNSSKYDRENWEIY